MTQRRPTPNGSQVRHGGSQLLRAFPVTGHDTFRPSGDPERDPPEVEAESGYRSMTMKQQRSWDEMMMRGNKSYVERTIKENRYWDDIRLAKERAAAPRPKIKRVSRKIRKVWKQLEQAKPQ